MTASVNMIALLVIVGVTTSFACLHGGGDKPEPQPDCRNGERCPEYMVAERAMGYEHRVYAPALWVGTRVVGMDHREGVMEGFDRLFKYISGENEEKKKIAMTSPVASMVMPNEDMTGFAMNMTVSFYISSEYYTDGGPPMPTNPDVHIVRKPELELYARGFPGYASSEMYLEEAAALSNLLADAGEPFKCGYFVTAGYDSPMKPFNRHNEVWIAKLADGEEGEARRCGGDRGDGGEEGGDRGDGGEEGGDRQ